jgi:coenzyme PQQ precursor peptide PqqA
LAQEHCPLVVLPLWANLGLSRRGKSGQRETTKERAMASSLIWTTPTLVEICIGLEINGYLPAEF